MQADGSEITRLTNIEERVNQPAWSPDGQWIAYVQRFDGFNLEIMVMPFGDDLTENTVSSSVRITHTGALDAEPDWSPDGSKIVFTSNRSGDMHIWVMAPNGSGRTQLSQNHNNGGQVWNSSPKWSPDGKEIIYRSDLGENNEILIMNSDGSGQRNLTQHPASDVDPAWSPDGSRIAFISDRDGNEEIYMMNADGSSLQRLTDHKDKDTYPTWSPDGAWIAFYSMRNGNYEIFSMRTDGSDLSQLTDHYNFDGFPAWQPVYSGSTPVSISFEPEEQGFSPPPDPEITSWLEENLIPMDLRNPDGNKEILTRLGARIGAAQAVDLGNPYLGVHESYQIQADLIQYLVTEMRFDTLIFDIDWLLGLKLDEYIRTGEGDPAQILGEFPDARWRSQEALDVIKWLREHNQDPGDAPIIRVYGVMIPDPSLTMDKVLAYLEIVDPEQGARVERLLACLRAYEDDWARYNLAYLSTQGECRDKLQQAYEYISNRAESYQAASTPQEFALALHAMRTVQQAEEAYRALRAELRFIEENLRWIIQQTGEDAKVILWGENISNRGTNSLQQVYSYQNPLGKLLRPVMGETPYSIGFSFGSGGINAYDVYKVPPSLGALSIPPLPVRSFEWMAHYGGYPASLLLLDQIDLQQPGAGWLAEPIPLRLIGDLYAPILAEDYFVDINLLKTFDAIIYVDETTPSQLLP